MTKIEVESHGGLPHNTYIKIDGQNAERVQEFRFKVRSNGLSEMKLDIVPELQNLVLYLEQDVVHVTQAQFHCSVKQCLFNRKEKECFVFRPAIEPEFDSEGMLPVCKTYKYNENWEK